MSLNREHPAGNLQGLERWITAWAEASGEPAGRLRRRIGVLAIAGMLDAVRDGTGRPRFALKGGSALALRYAARARFSRDVDLVFRGAIGEVHALIVTVLAEGWSGFTGRALDPEPLAIPWATTRGARLQVKLQYRNRPFDTLALEVVASPAVECELVASLSLRPVGLEPPAQVPCLSLHHQIAEKLHACSDPLDGERSNDRVSDLMDLILIEDLTLHGRDCTLTRSACVQVFAVRASHPWPPVLTVQRTWPALWGNLVDENRFYLEDVAAAVDRVNHLIGRIDAAR